MAPAVEIKPFFIVKNTSQTTDKTMLRNKYNYLLLKNQV